MRSRYGLNHGSTRNKTPPTPQRPIPTMSTRTDKFTVARPRTRAATPKAGYCLSMVRDRQRLEFLGVLHPKSRGALGNRLRCIEGTPHPGEVGSDGQLVGAVSTPSEIRDVVAVTSAHTQSIRCAGRARPLPPTCCRSLTRHVIGGCRGRQVTGYCEYRTKGAHKRGDGNVVRTTQEQGRTQAEAATGR